MYQQSNKLQKDIIKKAAKIIQQGGLVVFPTETVYGLGANALNKNAVKKIFKVKGRPLDNPLIVHIAKMEDLSLLAKNIPKITYILTKKFWPGPLTLILFKKKIVPKEVTASEDTVAIRMPKNKIALELIRTSGFPIAAPSANLAGKPSSTTIRHVFEDFGSKVDLILDSGRTEVSGIESTVVDLTVKPPQILRPGGLALEELKKVLKDIQLHSSLLGKKLKDKAKSPGMKYRHYAPEAPLILVRGKKMIKDIQNLIKRYKKQNKKVGVLASTETKKFYKKADLILCPGSRKNLKEVAQNLFKTLREFDAPSYQKVWCESKKKVNLASFKKEAGAKKRRSQKRCGVDIILAETFPEKDIGFAIMHRLKKASQSC